MAQRIRKIPTRCELDTKTDSDFAAWADNEGRSKRSHISILIRKLTTLQKDRPADLIALGLLDPACVPVGGRR